MKVKSWIPIRIREKLVRVRIRNNGPDLTKNIKVNLFNFLLPIKSKGYETINEVIFFIPNKMEVTETLLPHSSRMAGK
jgi:hypothetical protein